MILRSRLSTVKCILQSIRQLHCPTSSRFGYEGPGKTTVSILNRKDGNKIYIDTYASAGFSLTNGSLILGPIIVFPRTFLCWNIKSAEEINEASLSLLTTLEPTPDIVVLGLETAYHIKSLIAMKKVLTSKDINVEILPIAKAVGIFNFLNNEGRYVVAGLLPPLEQNHSTVVKRLESFRAEKPSQKTIESKE